MLIEWASGCFSQVVAALPIVASSAPPRWQRHCCARAAVGGLSKTQKCLTLACALAVLANVCWSTMQFPTAVGLSDFSAVHKEASRRSLVTALMGSGLASLRGQLRGADRRFAGFLFPVVLRSKQQIRLQVAQRSIPQRRFIPVRSTFHRKTGRQRAADPPSLPLTVAS